MRRAGIELTWPGKGREAPPLATAADLHVRERFGTARDGDQLRLAGGWRNLLIAGDNLLALQALAEQHAGTVDLIYIDPPYATGLSYYAQATVADAVVERRAYRDQSDGGMAGYVAAMAERLQLMHRLLADTGHLFLHCDWRANSALRLVLDEIFGSDGFRNEIVWRRAPNLGRQAASRQLGRVIDTIYVYSKTPGAPFRGTLPKRRMACPLDRKGKPKGSRWDPEREAYFTTAPRGDYTDASVASLRKEGRIYESSTGTIYIKYFLVKGEDGRWYKEQPVDALWDDYEVRPLRHRPKHEAQGYDTQKPEGLLERIIGWASAPGDLVADFFVGSGTTVAVAEAMGRRWIASDRGQAAIAITRKRLLTSGDVQPFDVVSLAAAERRQWQTDQEDAGAVIVAAYREATGDAREAAFVYDEASLARADQAGTEVLLAWSWNDLAPTAAASERVLCTVPPELMRGVPTKKLRFAVRPRLHLATEPEGVTLAGVDYDPAALPKKLRSCDWRELIDGWMVDEGNVSGPFTASWHGEPGAWTAPVRRGGRVKVVTVIGDELVQRYEAPC